MRRIIQRLRAWCGAAGVRALPVVLMVATAFADEAKEVHVYQQTVAGGVTNRLSDQTLTTGGDYTTQTAPGLSGYIFTHWSIAQTQTFANRDRLGRAKDSVSYHLYEETTLTANYLPVGEDADGDGIADGLEIYWYGSLKNAAMSDTDGDGLTFAEEVEMGTNPLMANEAVEGGVVWSDGSELRYNPTGLQPYTIRSEPEGTLFATISDYAVPGTSVTTPNCSPLTSSFAYWTCDGVRVQDRHGRAVDGVTFAMPSQAVEYVAHCIADADVREQFYWYGRETAMTSDTDGDGLTLAEEIAAGTNPLMANEAVEGGVVWAQGDLLQYNVEDYKTYVIRSEPEGQLFATKTDIVKPGTTLTSPVCSQETSSFAYWTLNGVRQQDRHGRALNQVSFVMPEEGAELVAQCVADADERAQLYWYGTATSMTSDTDGDGLTLAEEIAAGTNPLMANEAVEGGVVWAQGALLETDLQVYEQSVGALVDGDFVELFTSPIAGNGATSRTFGTDAVPVVTDVNGDGLFDLVVLYQGGSRLFVNIGSSGNPEFEERTDVNTNGLDLATGDVDKLAGMTFDTPPVNALSATTNGTTMLVSDTDGRIWLYELTGERWVLQHKVWGGSSAGFANGLHLAAVDWDGDGDLDCVCGTAEGKLMLLRDPKVGRPSNLRAKPGVDNVLLDWDPNAQSRVRGYRVYRAVGAESETYSVIGSPVLPTYRDCGLSDGYYGYRVSALSRFYTAGYSMPTEAESALTDPVYVQMRPDVWLNDTSSYTDTNVEVIVSMDNSMGLSSDGFTMTFAYDPAVLEPVEMKSTGLTEGLAFEEVKVKGEGEQWHWKLVSSGGEIGTGAGRFLRLAFYVKPVKGIDETVVSITAATVKASDGRAVELELPKSAKIELSERKPTEPALVTVHVDDAAVETETEFELGVTVTSTETLTNFVAEVAYDEKLLELRGVGGAAAREGTSSTVKGIGADFALKFFAKDPESVLTNLSTVVALTNIVAVDCHGLTANAADASGTVLLKNKHPWIPATVGVSTENKKVDTLEEVVVPFKVTSNTPLSAGTFTVAWDEAVLEYIGVNGGVVSGTSDEDVASPLVVEATEDFSLTFLAKDQHSVTKTLVSITAAQVMDVHGFVALPEVPVSSTILIHDAHPLVPAKVSLSLADVKTKTEQEFDMTLAVTTTEALTNFVAGVSFDESLLELRKVVGASVRSGGTPDPTIVASGSVPSEIVLTFYAKENHTVGATDVTISPFSGTDHNGLAAEFAGDAVGKVVFEDSNPWLPATVGVNVGSAKVDTLTEFELPVTITSSQKLTNFVATVEWDEDVLEFKGADGAEVRAAGTSAHTIVGSGTNFALKFYAKNQHTVTSTQVRLVDMLAVDEHGLVANPIADAAGTVLIHDAQPPVPAKVVVKAGNVQTKTLANFTVSISVTTTKNLTNLSFAVGWDSSLLEYRGCVGGVWKDGIVTAIGSVPEEILLTFYAKGQHTVTSTKISLSAASAWCTEGLVAEVTTADGTIAIEDSDPPVAATFALSALDARAESGKSFVVNVGAESDAALKDVTVTVSWDSANVSFASAEGATSVETLGVNERRIVFPASGTDNRYKLNFTASKIAGLQAQSWAKVTAASAMGANDLAAKLVSKLPATSNILIVRTIGKYDPGDINGDGQYTDADLDLLNHYIAYLNLVKVNPKIAARYASWNLTGNALKAADVNQDGIASDANDVSMLAQFIAAAKEVAQ